MPPDRSGHPRDLDAAGLEQAYQRYESIFADRSAPFAFVDLDAMWENADGMLLRARRLPIRIATKSIRSRDVLRRILGGDARFRGLMTFTLAETLWLALGGFENVLLAYPATDRDALRAWAELDAEKPPAVMIDSVEHLDFIDACVPASRRRLRVCLDLDVGYRRFGGRLRFGARRSPVRSPEHARALAQEVTRRPGFELMGVMAYEAHVAGTGDRPPGRPLRGRIVGALQRRWIEDVRARRADLVRAVRDVADIEVVNGGGTGSLHMTADDPMVTEVTAGSGFYAPALFDGFSAFSQRPAAAFALPVVRRPEADIVTALGGGYIASGAAGRDRSPTPWLPAGLRLDRMEGAGEVQTPLRGAGARRLRLGDRVYLRHAKAGELCERFDSLVLVQGDEVVDEVPTYRGDGMSFL